MAFSVIYAHTAFVSLGANKVKPRMLEKAVNDDPSIVTALDRVRVENPGTGSAPDVDDPTGRTWAFIFVGAGPLSGPETTALNAIVAAHTGVESYDPSPRNGGSAGQFWSNVDGTSYAWATPPGAGGGEANTTSNAGATGTGIALAKVGTDLPIAKIDGVGGITESLVSSVLQIDGTALLPRDGSRAMTAGLDMGGFTVSNVGNVDGRDVSADGSVLDTHTGNATIHVPALGTALQVLRVNAGATATEWSTPVDGVTAPGTTVVGRVPTFADVTGDALAQSSVSISGGDITGVTTLNASGAITASNVAGTNTGDQTITLTGDVTGSGTGSFAATIAADSVTYAKIQNISAASRLLGRGSAAGSGDVQELTLSGGISIAGTAVSGDALLPRDGTRAMTGALDMGSQAITNVGNVDGRDVSADGSTLDTHTGNTLIHVPALGTAGQVLAVNAGATATEWVAAGGGGGGAVTYGANPPSGGADGDVYYQQGNLMRWTKVSGTWVPRFDEFVGGHGPQAHVSYGARARYATTSVDVFGGASLNQTGSGSAQTYSTGSVRATRNRLGLNPTSTANTISSGVYSNALGAFNASSTLTAGKVSCVFEFALTSVTQSNFRFFSGIVSNITFATDPSTASGHGLGDRIGLIVDANTSLAAQWQVNVSNANSQLASAYTLVADNWYIHKIYMAPGSITIYQELWEISSQTSAPALVASTSHTPSSFSIVPMRLMIMGANAGTASGAGTINFGQLWMSQYH